MKNEFNLKTKFNKSSLKTKWKKESRNEKIRLYIQEVDLFMNTLNLNLEQYNELKKSLYQFIISYIDKQYNNGLGHSIATIETFKNRLYKNLIPLSKNEAQVLDFSKLIEIVNYSANLGYPDFYDTKIGIKNKNFTYNKFVDPLVNKGINLPNGVSIDNLEKDLEQIGYWVD